MSPSDYWQSAEGARTLSASVQIKTSCCVLELADLLADALGTWTGLRGSYCTGLQMLDHHAAVLIPKLEPQLAHAWLSSAHRQGVKHPQPAHTAATCAMACPCQPPWPSPHNCVRSFPALNTLDVNQNGIGGSLPASWGSASAFPELLNLVSLLDCQKRPN